MRESRRPCHCVDDTGANSACAARPANGIHVRANGSLCVAEQTQVSAGGDHTCGLRNDGSIVCCGRDDNEQVSAPACGVHASGGISCRGHDDWGKTSAPEVPGLNDDHGSNFTQVAAGAHHTCGLRDGGSVTCWIGGRTGVAVPNTDLTQIAIGDYHGCALRADRSLTYSGHDSFGQVSKPNQNDGNVFTQISAGGQYTCGLRTDGSCLRWGNRFIDTRALVVTR